MERTAGLVPYRLARVARARLLSRQHVDALEIVGYDVEETLHLAHCGQQIGLTRRPDA